MSGDSPQSHVQPSLLGKLNEQQVLRVILATGPASRADVSRLTGISAPTVSKAVASLIESGLLEETDDPQKRRGRPAKRLLLARQRSQVIGVVIDSPNCLVVRSALDGTIEDGDTIPVPIANDYDDLIDRLVAEIRRFVTETDKRTLGVGISVPGLVDNVDKVCRLSPNVPVTNGKALERDFRERLADQEGAIDHVVMFHETDCLCLAERYFGKAKQLTDYALMDVSTGVGLGAVMGGSLLRGHRGYAGEIGHIPLDPRGRQCGCGKRGCLETVASDRALAEMLSDRYGPVTGFVPETENESRTEFERWLEAVRSDAVNADEALEIAGSFLSTGLTMVLDIFNPSHLFVHGQMFDMREGMFEEIVARTKEKSLTPSADDCEIVRAEGDKSKGAVAAIVELLAEDMTAV